MTLSLTEGGRSPPASGSPRMGHSCNPSKDGRRPSSGDTEKWVFTSETDGNRAVRAGLTDTRPLKGCVELPPLPPPTWSLPCLSFRIETQWESSGDRVIFSKTSRGAGEGCAGRAC